LDEIVEATQRVYNAVATNLKPTPNKSHYTFNLRDMSKIFQGLCSANSKTTTQVVELIRLWIHENKRVFGDRMISQEDRDTLDDLLNDEVINSFKLTKEQVYVTERIIFGDYMSGIDSEIRPYIWIQDLKDMVKKIESYLEDYNSGQKNPMKLVMFLDACDHVSRICRILRQPQGNALLLGVGGSGR
jgi:dynein heavy chain